MEETGYKEKKLRRVPLSVQLLLASILTFVVWLEWPPADRGRAAVAVAPAPRGPATPAAVEPSSAELVDLIARQNATIHALRTAVVDARRKAAENAQRPAVLSPLQQRVAAGATPPRSVVVVEEPVLKKTPLIAPSTLERKKVGAESFRGHAILNMTAAERRTTPVNELLRPYPPTQGGGTCERDFGNGLINYWRA